MSRRGRLRKLLVEATGDLEREWDPALGGRETRPYRDLVAYAAAKLVLSGAQPEAVISYLGELLSEHGAELVDLRDALANLSDGNAGDVDEDTGGTA